MLRAAHVRLPCLPLAGIAFRIDAAFLKRLDVIQAGSGIEGRREPISGSVLRRANFGALRGRLLVEKLDRAPIRPDTASPREVLDKRFGQQKRAVAAIKDVEESVAIGLQ